MNVVIPKPKQSQNSEQIKTQRKTHEADAKRGKMCTRESRVSVGLSFTPDWTKKWRTFFFKAIV